MAVTKVEQRKRLQRNEEKWSRTLMDAGWTVIPSVILESQKALGLDPIDVNILLQLATYWWYPENLPHPSKARLASSIGVDPSTVRRHIARLEADGLIEREARFDPKTGRQETNRYSFDGLIKEATPYAKEALAEREDRRLENAARRERKKPKLQTIRGKAKK
jgi:DNA-binding MarR family transcriptional regulator